MATPMADGVGYGLATPMATQKPRCIYPINHTPKKGVIESGKPSPGYGRTYMAPYAIIFFSQVFQISRPWWGYGNINA